MCFYSKKIIFVLIKHFCLEKLEKKLSGKFQMVSFDLEYSNVN